MDIFFLSAITVGIAEIGDRSLFLALLFGLRYRRPWPIFFGMALGLFVNQVLSAWVGMWLFQFLNPVWQAWLVGILFLCMAVWVLLPEEDEDNSATLSKQQLFLTAAVTFFLLEMADKTQLAVITLAGHYQVFWPVVLGATVGILATTAPALWLGHRFAEHIPVTMLKRIASALFVALALWILLGVTI